MYATAGTRGLVRAVGTGEAVGSIVAMATSVGAALIVGAIVLASGKGVIICDPAEAQALNNSPHTASTIRNLVVIIGLSIRNRSHGCFAKGKPCQTIIFSGASQAPQPIRITLARSVSFWLPVQGRPIGRPTPRTAPRSQKEVWCPVDLTSGPFPVRRGAPSPS